MKRRNFAGTLVAALALPISLKASSGIPVDEITTTDRLVLRQQDAETLAEWSCILNGWGWPKMLPDPEPPTYVQDGRRGQIMRAISARIGYGAVLWKHNQSVMTREQFDCWFKHGGNSDIYKARYPFQSEQFQKDVNKRWEHKKVMFARHGAEHMEYIES